jgi:hypothetical protein
MLIASLACCNDSVLTLGRIVSEHAVILPELAEGVEITSYKPTFGYLSDLGECLGDHALTVSLLSRWESDVSVCPGLSTFTRIFLPFSSLSHVRANER